MSAVSYDAIAPNIANVEVNGATLRVRWKCPVTGREAGESEASMSADPSVTGRVQASVKRSIVAEVIYGAVRMISGLIGGAAGRVVSNAAYTAAAELNSRLTAGSDYTEASRQEAIVSAFAAVQDSFAWNEQHKRFVAR